MLPQVREERIVIAVRIRYIRSNCILPNEGMPKESHSLIRAVSLRIMTAASRSEVIGLLFRLFQLKIRTAVQNCSNVQ